MSSSSSSSSSLSTFTNDRFNFPLNPAAAATAASSSSSSFAQASRDDSAMDDVDDTPENNVRQAHIRSEAVAYGQSTSSRPPVAAAAAAAATTDALGPVQSLDPDDAKMGESKKESPPEDMVSVAITGFDNGRVVIADARLFARVSDRFKIELERLMEEHNARPQLHQPHALSADASMAAPRATGSNRRIATTPASSADVSVGPRVSVQLEVNCAELPSPMLQHLANFLTYYGGAEKHIPPPKPLTSTLFTDVYPNTYVRKLMRSCDNNIYLFKQLMLMANYFAIQPLLNVLYARFALFILETPDAVALRTRFNLPPDFGKRKEGVCACTNGDYCLYCAVYFTPEEESENIAQNRWAADLHELVYNPGVE